MTTPTLQSPPTVRPSQRAPAPAAPCCAASDTSSAKPCGLCGKPTCRNCRGLVNGQAACEPCQEKGRAQVEAERTGVVNLPAAIGAGLVGSLVGGAVWALIGILTSLEIGYVAVGVGWLAGMAVVMGAGWKKSPALQLVSVACAVLGLALGKYFTIVHAIKGMLSRGGQELADSISYTSPETVGVFFQLLPEVVTPFDALWLLLALGVAWRLPKPTVVKPAA